MAHRMFSDATGREWLVWDVVPQSADRRDLADRRIAGEDRRHEADEDGQVTVESYDRRLGVPRRAVPSRRADDDGADGARAGRAFAHLPTEYSDGWLCFESGTERRRLGPTPVGWATLPDTGLCQLLEQATAVPARATRIDTSKMRAMVRPEEGHRS